MKTICLIAILLFPACLLASPVESMGKTLKSGAAEKEVAEIAKELSHIISAKCGGPLEAEKIGAVKLVEEYKLMDCLPAILQQVANIDPIHDGLVPLEQMYPCVSAIAALGESAVPSLTQAIGDADSALKLKLLSYALMKIKTKEVALEHLDAALQKPGLADTTRKNCESAKTEIGKWN